ncbi:hypothetical protein [Paludisphaera rhizosphaerae]|uniref:hypothetical protein n=1 Tax=Paludisphaera rhizosphaerae TaxID=2711216 RepID=UPI0013EAD316|nr:hypothetical protein [Paludisphaera rhizosphaerae]
MRRLILLLAAVIALTGCTTTGPNGQPEADYSLLRGAFSGANWGAWTPEFPPDGTADQCSHR